MNKLHKAPTGDLWDGRLGRSSFLCDFNWWFNAAVIILQVAWFGMARPKKHQRKTSHHGTLSRKRKAPAQQGGSKKKPRKAEVASKASESDSDYVSDTDEGSPAYTTAQKVNETDDEFGIT